MIYFALLDNVVGIAAREACTFQQVHDVCFTERKREEH